MPHRFAWVVLFLPSIALAGVNGRGASVTVQAERTTARIQIDGRLNEDAWRRAPPFSDFIQSFPEFGAAPSARTIVRVLYDSNFLYVGFVCDARPEEIARRMTRRDSLGEVDLVSVAVDSMHDHRTAYKFQVSVAGVKKDSLHFDDYRASSSWDEVWDAAAADVPEGWSAEFAIPLSIFSFSSAREQTWGVSFDREIPIRKETVSSVPIPSDAKAEVSLFGHLTGLVDLKPPLRLEVVPFLATRATSETKDSLTDPRLTLPSSDVGADFRVGLSRSMTLNGTINPDFGQVEADTIRFNLTNFEEFFPEKRPFFMQGMSIFHSIGSDESSPSPQSLFYSRRIGLSSPILGAAKLSGNPMDRVEIGVLDAVVAGASHPNADEDAPDLTPTWNWRQPLHVGPVAALPTEAPIPTNYFTAAARAQLLPSLTVGPTVSMATPLTPRCTEADAGLEDPPQRCFAEGANVAGFQWNLADAEAHWGFWGQLAGSHAVGGMPRTLRDGTQIRPGTTGGGLYFTMGKLGGEPFRFIVTGEYASPTLDVNPTGFQENQNEKSLEGELAYYRNREGPFRKVRLKLKGQTKWSTDGREVPRGDSVEVSASAYLPGYHEASVKLAYEDPRFDIREIRGTGIPYERPTHWEGELEFDTDDRKPVQLGLQAEVKHWPARAALPAAYGVNLSASVALVPAPWLKTDLKVEAERSPQGAEFKEADGVDYFFAGLRADSVSVTLEQLVAFTPNLTFQLYTQLFTGTQTFGRVYMANAANRRTIYVQDLKPTTAREFGEDNEDVTAWNVNAVLRWEYRLGSALYLAYTRRQDALPADGAVVRPTLEIGNLGRSEIEDVLMLKWTYWWGS